MTVVAASIDSASLVDAARVVNLLVTGAAAAVLVRSYRRAPRPSTGWALGVFAVLALVVAAGMLEVTDDGSLVRHTFVVVLVCLLLLVPFMLVRFAHSLGAVGPTSLRVATGLTVAQLAYTVALPRFPEPGEPRSGWFSAYVVLILVAWSVQSVTAAVGLWRAGRDQPSVVRHRMRALSSGAVVVALTLVGGSASDEPGGWGELTTTLVGVVGICLLVLAFVVPDWLRAAWRSEDLLRLAAVERGLMTAVLPEDVARDVVPAVVRLFGASGAALLDVDRRPVVVEGSVDAALVALREGDASGGTAGVLSLAGGAFACRLDDGWLLVQAGAFAPVFGPAELSLLDRVGSFADLALQRCRLFQEEARSRKAAEAASAELQTIVYSVSHDLRNPIISVLGYVDVLAQEHAGELTGPGAHYLERISVNALYMQNLIQDLLELSRIGRSEPPPEAVAVGSLAESVAQEVRVMHPGCDVVVEGRFPVVWVSELRMRQLLTNLVDNAAKHSGGEARVLVSAEPHEDGALIVVSDDGPGIAPAYRDKAFDVFERLDAARGDVPGTGMGLPICKRIVEAMGGTIEIGDPRPGSPTGATVRIILPARSIQAWYDVTPISAKEGAS